MNKVIISVLGQDRPGILAAVSGILFKQDCNIENVTQTNLQTEFAGIFIVAIPDGLTPSALQETMKKELSETDLQIYVKPMVTKPPEDAESGHDPYVITTRGPDNKGLVAGITKTIAAHNVNVTNLTAVFKGGLEPGDNIMLYEIDVPASADFTAMHDELRTRADELGIEINIQHRKIFDTVTMI
ncbi:MAG: ACT domain-containing protein [Desulfobacterales bacterium]|nr:ACT domain-containing protein [Desulfobacterales bacterium]